VLLAIVGLMHEMRRADRRSPGKAPVELRGGGAPCPAGDGGIQCAPPRTLLNGAAHRFVVPDKPVILVAMEERERAGRPRDPTVEILSHGVVQVRGVVPWSSNYTFVATVAYRDAQVLAVYKPEEGSRPLWDFDRDTLCQREVATYRLSVLLGWPSVPPVVLRKDAPHGPGSVQLFVEHDRRAHYFTLRDDPRHTDALRRIAVFDYLVNNADRKAGHVLAGLDGRIWAIDHGLTFHREDKLRTVIWDWAGDPIPDPWLEDLRRLQRVLEAGGSQAVRGILELISTAEREALLDRLRTLLDQHVLPRPCKSRRNVPYPLV